MLTVWKSRRPAIFHRASCIEALQLLLIGACCSMISISSRDLSIFVLFFPSSSSSSSFLMICETLRDYIHSLLINRYYFRTRKLLFRKLKLCITMRLTAERQQIFWLMNSIDTPPFFLFFLLSFLTRTILMLDHLFTRFWSILFSRKNYLFIRVFFYVDQQQARNWLIFIVLWRIIDIVSRYWLISIPYKNYFYFCFILCSL